MDDLTGLLKAIRTYNTETQFTINLCMSANYYLFSQSKKQIML